MNAETDNRTFKQFLNLDIGNIWGQKILCHRGYCVQYKMFSSMPGLYPLDAGSTTTTSCDNQKCVQTVPKVPWRQKGL